MNGATYLYLDFSLSLDVRVVIFLPNVKNAPGDELGQNVVRIAKLQQKLTRNGIHHVRGG